MLFFSGLGIGFSLIVAIGAQNAFVLKQGLMRQHVFIVCLICALSDTILISLGVTGFSGFIKSFSDILKYAQYAGSIFLFLYGAKHFYAAFSNYSTLKPSDADKQSLRKIIAVCLAFTWLNPHVYLDTVMFVGLMSISFQADILFFALGTISASWIFFFSLGYGARLLLPIFNKKIAWNILDFLIGIVMWVIAFNLLNLNLKI